MKRIILCLDGTWNRPDDKLHATNVVKIMRAIRHADDDGIQQVAFYDKGVGTGGPVDRIIGGALGSGLDENIRDGYRFLANNYEAGDEIYIFGFSRGAFTARSLAGFVSVCGLLNKRSMGSLMRAWNLYRIHADDRDPAEVAAVRGLGDTNVPIACVGVWDTVGALGVPVQRFNLVNRKHEFHDTNLGAGVGCALHAIAIDEKRGPFAPTLWQAAAPNPGQIVEQVWFAGVHSNIGGSYDDPGLSDLTLDWMIKRVAKHTPLAFDEGYIAESVNGDAMATIYESRSAMYAMSLVLPFQRVLGGFSGWVRKFRPLTNQPREGHRFVNEMIHQSALDRMGQKAPFQSKKTSVDILYVPAGLKAAKGHLPVVGYDGEPNNPS